MTARAIYEQLALDSPSDTHSQDLLARSHYTVGSYLSRTGNPTEAMKAFETARTIWETHLRGNAKQLETWCGVIESYNRIGDSLRQLGRNRDALASYDRALELGESLVRELPEKKWYWTYPASSLRGRGLARLEQGDLSGAADDTHRSLYILDSLPTRDEKSWFDSACCRATLASLAGRTGSGVRADRRGPEADRAVLSLRAAIETGYRSLDIYLAEAALEPIRNRDDVRQLLMDLAMPDDPFAP